jgi:hypothetical protein
MLRFEARGLRVNSALPSRLLLLSFLLPFTWGRHRRARATTALSGASSLYTCSSMIEPTDYRCLSPLRRKTSELEGEEKYTSIFHTLQARLPEFTWLATTLNLFPQIRVARTTIKLVSRSISSHRFEYLAGKRYVASDWFKTVKKSTFFHCF